MLYVTTRNNRDVYTPHHVILKNRSVDGGSFVPFRIPCISDSERSLLGSDSFNTCVAKTLAFWFNLTLSPEDLEQSIGIYPVEIKHLYPKIILAECWHNPVGSILWFARKIKTLFPGIKEAPLTEWMLIVSRIAILHGLFAELVRSNILCPEKKLDIAAVSGNMSALISAMNAKSAGLPVGNILCCCKENDVVWELFRYGQIRADQLQIKTASPNMEHLIYTAGGAEEARRYLEAQQERKTYYMSDYVLKKIRSIIHLTVSSNSRISELADNIFERNSWFISSHTALACAGIQDYRAATGLCDYTLILGETKPHRP